MALIEAGRGIAEPRVRSATAAAYAVPDSVFRLPPNCRSAWGIGLTLKPPAAEFGLARRSEGDRVSGILDHQHLRDRDPG